MADTIPDPSDRMGQATAAKRFVASAEAEQAVLASLLQGGPESARAWESIRDEFSEDLFASSDATRHLARVVESLFRAGRPVDVVLVSAELERLGLLGSVMQPTFAYELAGSIGSIANVEHYLRLLIALRAERRGDAARHDPPPPLIGDKLVGVLDRLARRHEGAERPVQLPEAWTTTSRLLGGGLWPGCYILVGNTASGKSQFALQVTHCAAHSGTPAAYIGLELDDLGIGARLLALEHRTAHPTSPIAWSHLYNGQDVDGLNKALATSDSLARLPFHVLTAPPFGWGYEGVLSVAERMRSQYPEKLDLAGRPIPGSAPFILVLDFLQIIGGTNGAGRMLELRERIAQASYAARDAARRLNAVVILVSSTARENYATLDGDPDRAASAGGKEGKGRVPFGEGDPSRFVGLGKESGEIELSADCALVLGRLPGQAGPPPWDMSLGVAKVRARSADAKGLDGWVRFRFDGTFFGEMSMATRSAPMTARHAFEADEGDDR